MGYFSKRSVFPSTLKLSLKKSTLEIHEYNLFTNLKKGYYINKMIMAVLMNRF